MPTTRHESHPFPELPSVKEVHARIVNSTLDYDPTKHSRSVLALADKALSESLDTITGGGNTVVVDSEKYKDEPNLTEIA